MMFWLALKVEVSYNRVIIIYLEGFWCFLEDLFED
jgi:hypothetical protein